MPRGAPASKVAITVDREVYARIVAAAREEHKSVSAWMTSAARRALTIRAGLAAIAEWEAEHGSLTEDELTRARARVDRRRPRLKRST